MLYGWRCDADLAGVMVRKMQLSILRGDSREQKRPALLSNAVMIVWPVGWSGLHCRVCQFSWDVLLPRRTGQGG